MEGEKIDTLNQALPKLYEEISVNPRVADKAHFGIISFSTSAEVILQLSNLSDVEEVPELSAAGVTNYTAAFDLLRDTIEQDVKRLKGEQQSVLRPVVFFLSDGMPTDGNGYHSSSWMDAYDALVAEDFKAHPHIIAFGIGECDADTIRRIGTFRAFIQADDSVSPADALREFATSLSKSIVRSVSRTDASPEPRLYVDEKIPGFVSLPLDSL
jgi:uncharacterized protein YegL